MDDITRKAALRYQECKIMAEAARFQGLAVDQKFVNRHYRRFRSWYEGRLTLGYLVRSTGAQFAKKGR